MSSTDETKQFIPLNIAVLTISDTRSREDDKSGTTLADRLTAAGHVLAAREIIVDDVDAIRIIISDGSPTRASMPSSPQAALVLPAATSRRRRRAAVRKTDGWLFHSLHL